MTHKLKDSGGGFISGLIAGGMSLYLLDPDKCGHRRRILARDKSIRGAHVASRFIDKAVRDIQNRIRGLFAEAWARLREREIPDDVLVRRVCAGIGRVVSHPGAIAVKARHGVVELSGPILEDEVAPLLKTVRSVRGVHEVDDHLEPHKTPDIPGLQGGMKREPRPELFQERWAPATRTVIGLSGIGLLSLASRRPSLRLPLGVTGGALLIRALTNMPLSEAFGVAETPNVVTLRKTVSINAPVEELYQLFANPENFPRIFEHVEDVRHSRDDLYHWTVRGPGGMSVSWESILTENIPNEVIAWRSRPDATVTKAGLAKFQRNADGGTAVHIQSPTILG